MQKDYIHKCVIHAFRPARVFVLMLALGGCGLKGDLYLPPAGSGDEAGGTAEAAGSERGSDTGHETETP